MFTGLIEAIGVVAAVEPRDAGRGIEITAPWTDLVVGESVAVDGACLTVEATSPRPSFWITAVSTTLARTTLGAWTVGRRVNLERAMPASGRFGGHVVQGHVDSIGHVVARSSSATPLLLDIELPEGLMELMVPHGALTVNGVSLTVNALLGRDVVQVSLVPHTLSATNLADLTRGDAVHVEADIIGKYVRRLLEGRAIADTGGWRGNA